MTGAVLGGVTGQGEGGGMPGEEPEGGYTGAVLNGGSPELTDCQIVDRNKIACPDGEYVKIPSTSNSLRSSVEKEGRVKAVTTKLKKLVVPKKAKAH